MAVLSRDNEIRNGQGVSFPRVSIVMPVYNVELFLKETLDSVVNQTVQDVEIICVDDGSTDGSWEILKSYAEFDKRFILQRNPKNVGAAASRNIGMQIAGCKYIMFLDSDDIYDLDFIEKMLYKAEKHEADICICGFKSFRNKSEIKSGESAPLVLPPEFDEGYNSRTLPDRILYVGGLAPQYKMYRRDFLVNHDISFQKIKNSNDVYFGVTSMLLADKIIYLPEILVHYRVHENQTSSSRKIYFYEDYKAWRKVYNRLAALDCLEHCYKSYATRCADSVMYQCSFIPEEEKNSFKSFWRNKGFADVGMKDCKQSDFLSDSRFQKYYNFYSEIMSMPEDTMAKVVNTDEVKDDVNAAGHVVEFIFPENLFQKGSKVFLWGRKEIYEAFLEQIQGKSYDVNIVGVSDEKDVGEKLQATEFQYVLICEKDTDKAKAMKETLLDLDVEAKRVQWSNGCLWGEFLNSMYSPLISRMKRIRCVV